MNFRSWLTGVIGLLATVAAYAQDPNFSQFYAAPLYLNPALAGAERDVTLGTVFRSQWRSAGFPQQIGQLAGVIPLNSRKQSLMPVGGIGFALYNDVAGEGNNFRATGVQTGAAYNLRLNADYSQMLSFGLQVGLVQKTIDFSDLRWGSQYEPAAPYFGFNPGKDVANAIQTNGLRDKVLYPVVHSGVVWHFNPRSGASSRPLGGFVGFSVSNMNQPDESLIKDARSRLPFLLRGQAGLEYEITPSFRVMPNLLWMRQNGNNQINVGTYLAYQLSDEILKTPAQVMVGGWYRVQDSFVLATAVTNFKYTLGFSYDINTSSLRYATRGRGAWEVSLAYRMLKNKSARRFATPLI